MDIFIVIRRKTTEREMDNKLTLEEEYSLICEEKFKNQDCSSKEDIVSVLSLILGVSIYPHNDSELSYVLPELRKMLIEKSHPLKLKKNKKENLIDIFFYYLNHAENKFLLNLDQDSTVSVLINLLEKHNIKPKNKHFLKESLKNYFNTYPGMFDAYKVFVDTSLYDSNAKSNLRIDRIKKVIKIKWSITNQDIFIEPNSRRLEAIEALFYFGSIIPYLGNFKAEKETPSFVRDNLELIHQHYGWKNADIWVQSEKSARMAFRQVALAWASDLLGKKHVKITKKYVSLEWHYPNYFIPTTQNDYYKLKKILHEVNLTCGYWYSDYLNQRTNHLIIPYSEAQYTDGFRSRILDIFSGKRNKASNINDICLKEDIDSPSLSLEEFMDEEYGKENEKIGEISVQEALLNYLSWGRSHNKIKNLWGRSHKKNFRNSLYQRGIVSDYVYSISKENLAYVKKLGGRKIYETKNLKGGEKIQFSLPLYEELFGYHEERHLTEKKYEEVHKENLGIYKYLIDKSIEELSWIGELTQTKNYFLLEVSPCFVSLGGFIQLNVSSLADELRWNLTRDLI